MTKTKSVDIRLKEANARFTKANAAYLADPSKVKSYRKAKTALAMVRQEHAEQRHIPNRPGDGQAQVKAVAAKAGTKTRR